MGLDSLVLAHLLYQTRHHGLAFLGSSSPGFKSLTLGHWDSGSQETIQFWIQMLDINYETFEQGTLTNLVHIFLQCHARSMLETGDEVPHYI